MNAQPSASRNAIVIDPTIAAQTGGAGDTGRVRAADIENEFGVDANGDGELDGLDQFIGTGPAQGNFNPIPGQDGIAESALPNRRIYIDNFRLAASLSWELDLWGRLTDETRAAYNDARASFADLRGTQLSIAGSIAQGWFLLIESRQQRELAERDVAAREANLRVTERRYDRGVASSLDVRLSRSALGSSRASLALRQQTEKEASRRLEVLLGRYPSAELAAAAELPELPRLEGAGAPGEILARRPDILAAEMRMEAAGLRARAARKQLLPSISVSGNINTSGPVLADVIDPERLAGNIAAGLFQPLFQGGRIRANIKQQRALAEASLLNYAQTALMAYEEAENALAAEELLANQEEALKVAFEEAAAAEELTERRYASGAATIFNLLDAQTRRITSESAYISARRQRVSNRVQLYLAIGGDFMTDEDIALARAEGARQGVAAAEPIPVATGG
ncbi:MAG: TolC family protein [Pseudomonadota bacterium]